MRPCVHPETLLTRYLAEYLTHFHQTYIDEALWDRDECFAVWGQKVKGQGHGGITYAGTVTARADEAYSTRHLRLHIENWKYRAAKMHEKCSNTLRAVLCDSASGCR